MEEVHEDEAGGALCSFQFARRRFRAAATAANAVPATSSKGDRWGYRPLWNGQECSKRDTGELKRLLPDVHGDAFYIPSKLLP
ncbi:hypothetical protein GWI33_001861 [Rhynchophorus ferrugineus]|uniref:Uncharacterized protein n=1 Tax=Rhynchophorus ferrugineus TaxID=354439 RepID=A0A834HJY8_RHYFE|nr:hypothetical protein GWI33_001861 [Rhynchophorus ferrugineus]